VCSSDLNIPINKNYTDDQSDVYMFTRLEMDKSFATYGPQLLNLYNNQMVYDSTKYPMPTIDISQLNGTTGRGDIMQNFLFSTPKGSLPTNSSIQQLPDACVITGDDDAVDGGTATLAPGVIDLSKIYQMIGTGSPGAEHLRLFANAQDGSATTDSD
jgi:hypothetical protein